MEATGNISRPPFDDTDADIIFRSGDGVDFRLYKNVAAKASTVFRDMFSLPAQAHPDAHEAPQTVPLTEDADTLERLFRLCYPFARPRFRTVDGVRAALAAARKYMMDALIPALAEALLRFLDAEPLRVYAVAYLFCLGDVARTAARALLEDPASMEPTEIPPELDDLPARALYSVFTYRRQCIDAAVDECRYMDWVWLGPIESASISTCPDTQPRRQWVWFVCLRGEHVLVDLLVRPLFPIAGASQEDQTIPIEAQVWWDRYIKKVKEALYRRPVARRLATEMSLIEPTVAEAAKCTVCAPFALGNMLEFSKRLAKKIEMAVAGVAIELPFDLHEDEGVTDDNF